MKSKLDPNKYPIANPFDWLVFSHPWQKNIDFVFACRLAALAEHMGVKININSGYRSTKEQEQSYIASGGKLVNGKWIGGSGMACKPGTSYHEFRVAIDTSDSWFKKIEKELATVNQNILQAFGIFKPLTKANKTIVYEDWHMQPVETIGVTNRSSMAPELHNLLDKGVEGFEVIELQMRLNQYNYKLKVDGDFGNITNGAVKDFQASHGLYIDGIVGQNTWNKLYE